MRWIFIVAFLLSSCAGPPAPDTSIEPPTQIPLKTIVPETFEANARVPSLLLVPKNVISLASIIRSRVEIRTAPGTEYSLKDALFKESEIVVVIDRNDVWRKVVALASPLDGWVHAQALRPYNPPTDIQELSSAKLPRTFAATLVQTIFEYPSLKPLKVSLPKGTIFVCLSRRGKQKIIYIAQTNSIAVVNESEFQ